MINPEPWYARVIWRGGGVGQWLSHQQQPVAFGAQYPFGPRAARGAGGAALPLCECVEVGDGGWTKTP